MEEAVMRKDDQVDQFQQEFEQRLARFDEQREKQSLEKLKRLDEEFPLRDRILALEEAKAQDNMVKNISELEKDYGSVVDAPALIFSLTDLLHKDFPPMEWLVESLLPLRGLIAISGLPGSYKSWVTQHLALAVATGTPLFGQFNTQQKKVLIIDKENQQSLIQKRFKLLGGLEGLDVYFLGVDFLIENEQLTDQICNLIRNLGIGLIIFDSLIRIYKGKDENSSNDMAQVFSQLRKFQEVGATVVFVHHHRKQGIFSKNTLAEAMRGSSDILASVDSHIAVDIQDESIRITQPKLRYDVPVKPFKLKLITEENRVEFLFDGEIEEDKAKLEEAREDILQALEEGETSRTELIERFKGVYGTKTVDGALKLLNENEIAIRIGERGKKFYRKTGTEPEGSLLNPDSQFGRI